MLWHAAITQKIVPRKPCSECDEITRQRLSITEIKEVLFEISSGETYERGANACEWQERGHALWKLCFTVDRVLKVGISQAIVCRHEHVRPVNGCAQTPVFHSHHHTYIMVRLVRFIEDHFPRSTELYPDFSFSARSIALELESFVMDGFHILDELQLARLIRAYLTVCPHWGCMIPNVELSVRGWQWHDPREAALYTPGETLPNMQDIKPLSVPYPDSVHRSAVFQYWLECDQSLDMNNVCAAHDARKVMQDYALLIHLHLGNDLAMLLFKICPLWTFAPLSFDVPFSVALKQVGQKVDRIGMVHAKDPHGATWSHHY